MTEQLDTTGQKAIEYLGLKHAARERALPRSRTAIRFCANSIRATHRQEFRHAGELLAQAAVLLAEMAEDLRDHQDIFYAGFVQDAQKELAEAAAFLALAQNLPLPEAQTLSIGWAPYLNGLGETVGELTQLIPRAASWRRLAVISPWLFPRHSCNKGCWPYSKNYKITNKCKDRASPCPVSIEPFTFFRKGASTCKAKTRPQRKKIIL